MPELRVTAASGSYPVTIEAGASGRVGTWARELAGGSRVLVVCDHNTAEIAGSRIARDAAAEILELAPGETTKTFTNVGSVCVAAAAAGLDRGSVVVAVGGGVVGDLAGTAAAVYLRGIRLVQVPTTLLAMVDSSIGGKVGVNLSAGKNLVGAFKPPEAVFVDPTLLEGLPEREFRSGMAEVIKSGLVGDAELSHLLDERGDAVRARRPEVLLEVIARTCAVKVGVVSRDETERGERMILNYGHTFGHALEAASNYSRDLTHGEAVGAGMKVAARLGVRAGITSPELQVLQARQLDAYGLPRRIPVKVGAEDVISAMAHDKKTREGRIRWVLLASLGRATWGHELEDAVVRETVTWALEEG
ncbi:MAG: 3-dehydroquinate synthase [Candidatus Dormibacteraeota bacterium]|nr:3-dehydroquinate synthase [Candidatus Dormibacteraeota bacterium]